MATFPMFSMLPVELQIQIWEYAVRPKDISLAHILTLTQGNTTRSRREGSFHNKSTLEFEVKSNSSTDLLDSGLWTACKLSSWVVEKHYSSKVFRQRKPKEEPKSKLRRKRKKDETYLHDLPFWLWDDWLDEPDVFRLGSQSDSQLFAILPRKDLICLDIPHGSSYQLFTPGDLYDKLPFGKPFKSKVSDINVAVAFDPAWLSLLRLRDTWLAMKRFTGVLGFLVALAERNFEDNSFSVAIWLIDYSVELGREGYVKSWWDEYCWYSKEREFVEVEVDVDVNQGSFPHGNSHDFTERFNREEQAACSKKHRGLVMGHTIHGILACTDRAERSGTH